MNLEDAEKQTPLIEAAAKNNVAISRLLLEHGANIEMFDNNQKSPIFWAAENNALDVIKVSLIFNYYYILV